MEKSFNKTNKRGKCPTCPGGHLSKVMFRNFNN